MSDPIPLPLTTYAHILIVDDEPEIARSVSDYLSKINGYKISLAGNGSEAVQILESSLGNPSKAIDLVLLDVFMPGMSGLEVLSWLRRNDDPELRFMRVIVLTAAAGNKEKVKALLGGADDYITKPFYPQELQARVKTLLRTQQLEKQLQRQSQQLAILNQLNQTLATKLTSKEVKDVAVEGLEAVLNVELAAIFLVNGKRDTLICQNVYPLATRFQAQSFLPVPVSKGVIGQAFAKQHRYCLNDLMQNTPFIEDLDAPKGFSARSLMAAPLYYRTKPIGVIAAYNKRTGGFNEIDEDIFASLTNSISQAIENAWLFQHLQLRQQEILENRNTLQAVIDGILQPIYVIDENWHLKLINRSKMNDLSLQDKGPKGEVCYRLLYNRNLPCEHCQAAVTLEQHQPNKWTVKLSEDVFRPQEWDVYSYPVEGLKPGTTGAVIIWQDRTEERRLENSLLQAGKLAAIGQLAAGVAHEINNPLTAINANAQMLAMTIPPEDDNYESVDLILQAGERAAQVVKGLLDFARQSQFELEPVDINKSLLQALNFVNYQFNTAHINVTTHLAEGIPEIIGSWKHLQSVWLNLFMNARDALLDVPREKTVEIRSRFDSKKGQLEIIIRDNGHGMSDAQQNHIFEPFFTTKAPGEGTGLGLATSHEIIQQHNGRIEVISAVDAGTTFIVRLPLSTR